MKKSAAEIEKLCVNETELAIMLGCSVHKIRKDRREKKGCPYTKNGRLVRYRKVDVDRFLENGVIQ